MRRMTLFFVITWLAAGASLAQEPEPPAEAAAPPPVVAPAAPCQIAGLAALLSVLTPFQEDPTCPGTRETCVDAHCALLTGAQRAQCIVTCSETPVCSECTCRCSSNCDRSCTRRCCRTTQGPPFRQLCCTRSCVPIPDVLAPGD